MKKLIQLIYVSRSSSNSVNYGGGIDPGVARILAKSRANNRKNGLVGVLYFGDGCFFQCIEGEEEAIDTLYRKLLNDERHRDLKVISRKEVPQLSFGVWSMKYILSESKINSILAEEQLSSFDPYRFSDKGIRKMLDLLHEAGDTEMTTTPSADSKPMRQLEQVIPVAKQPSTLVIVGLVIAAIAVGVFFLVR
ncbi:hypothetical protein AAKU67_004335 [Oxalobacteraceae bacterium GrIS 2.11]